MTGQSDAGEATTRKGVGRRPLIQRDDVVAAALRILKRDGAAALSMRALAAELGVSTMAAYHHVPNKDALIDLVVDEVYRPLTVEDAQGAPASRLLLLFRRARARLREYPGLGLLSFVVHRGTEATRVRAESSVIAQEGGMYHGERYAEAFSLAVSLMLTGSSTADSLLDKAARARFDRRVEDAFQLLLAGLRTIEDDPPGEGVDPTPID
jgi:AcrR family transcriptional regulator